MLGGDNKKISRIIDTHLIIAIIILAYYIALNALDITCPIRALSGYPCPACGMTRAMLSIVRFDFGAYVGYNVMAAPVIIGILLAIHFKRDKSFNRFIGFYLTAALIINTMYYVYRLIYGQAP